VIIAMDKKQCVPGVLFSCKSMSTIQTYCVLLSNVSWRIYVAVRHFCPISTTFGFSRRYSQKSSEIRPVGAALIRAEVDIQGVAGGICHAVGECSLG
jgi:hypothetical protein